MALHFKVPEQKPPAKPLQYLIALKEDPANCRRPVKGKTATSWMWAAVGLAMITDQNRDKVMVVPAPGFKQADGTIREALVYRRAVLGGQDYSTPEQKQAIFDFLKWWYQPDTQLEFAKKGGNPADKATSRMPSSIRSTHGIGR